MCPTWKRLDGLVGQRMGFQLMSEVDASLLQHAHDFTRCRVMALFRVLLMHGWHDPCSLTFRVLAALAKMVSGMQAQSAACASEGLMARLLSILGCPLLPAQPYPGSHTSVRCLLLTDRCTAHASCDAYPEMQELPRRVIAHNVPTKGCHARLVERRPQLGPLAYSSSALWPQEWTPALWRPTPAIHRM